MNVPDRVRALERDLREIFGSRLESLVVYASPAAGADTPTLALVDLVSADDLRACAGRVATWHEAGLATPLVLAAREFGRSLDTFPFEFGAILAEHAVVCGHDPFAGLQVDPAHLRHACEVQARSHLLHLREGYIETQGRADALAELLGRSAAPLAALLVSVARLHDVPATTPEAAAREVEKALELPTGSLARVAALASGLPAPADELKQLFPDHLAAIEQLTAYIDQWIAHG